MKALMNRHICYERIQYIGQLTDLDYIRTTTHETIYLRIYDTCVHAEVKTTYGTDFIVIRLIRIQACNL